MRWCVYLDMDAFYISCELKRHPELRGLPAAVSADPKGGAGRGVVLSASYEARKFGLRSALPVSQAYALCPQYRWVRADFSFYEENSRAVMALLKARSPEARSFSIDEAAYPWEGATPSAAEAEGRALQATVQQALELPCSIGIAPTLTLAKMASDRAKPGGVVVVPPDSVASFLAPLPVRAIPGIGQVTERGLIEVGARTIGELATLPVEKLRGPLGALARGMRDLARGLVKEEPWPEEEGPRSMGAMSTFDEDAREPKQVRSEVWRLGESLGDAVGRRGLSFRTVTVRVRLSDFRMLQKSRSLPQRTDQAEALLRTSDRLAADLVHEEQERRRGGHGPLDPGAGPSSTHAPSGLRGWGVRTVGVSISDLAEVPASQQRLDAFNAEPESPPPAPAKTGPPGRRRRRSREVDAPPR